MIEYVVCDGPDCGETRTLTHDSPRDIRSWGWFVIIHGTYEWHFHSWKCAMYFISEEAASG